MKLIKNFTSIIFFTFLLSCTNYQTSKLNKKMEKKYFSSKGFALIYEERYVKEGLINRRLKNDEIKVMHSFLKKNTPIKIINPENNKFVETKIFSKSAYPKIFNIVITKRIANELELNLEDPYIEILEIKKNKTFIAKESNIFDEEKKVAEKAPVDEIKVNVISQDESTIEKNLLPKTYNFTIVVSDFYYLVSANNLKQYLQKETQIDNFLVLKINKNKYRLSIGPFKNFSALKSTYISLNNLGFEDLNIYRE